MSGAAFTLEEIDHLRKPPKFLARLAAFAAVANLVTGCGGGSSTLTPQPRGPGVAAGPTPTPIPVGGLPSAAKVTAALADAEAFFASQPHADLPTDVSATAAHMTASKLFVAAVVGPGGITGTLPGGLSVMLFADRPEEYGAAASASIVARPESSTARLPQATFSGPATQHEIVYFINTTDQSGAFVPSRQVDLAAAWVAAIPAALDPATYDVQDLPVTLENIEALGATHPVDFLSLATHGMIAYLGPTKVHQYVNLSDTAVNAASMMTYANELRTGTVFAAAVLRPMATDPRALATFAFTPTFTTAHVAFNPGALFDNESCFGQETTIKDATFATLHGAGVGTYLGWTQPVDGGHADETDAFITDRLLGEPDAALDAYATQRTPRQRPFSLADVIAAVHAEQRSGLVTNATHLDYSPPSRRYAQANLVETVAPGSVDDAILVPSISTMTVTEGLPHSTLEIDGEFPAAKGTVVDTLGTSAISEYVESWSRTKIVIDLPNDGASSAGSVVVKGATGLESNGAPLTYWHGKLGYVENAQLGSFGNAVGSGTGTLSIAMNLGIRADVAPFVPTIDTAPVRPTFYVSDVTPDSTATLDKYSGSFASSDGSGNATITGTGPVALKPYATTASYLQISSNLDPVNNAPCNAGRPGVNAGTTNVACPGFQYAAKNAATCTDTSVDICGEAKSFGGMIGDPTSQFGDDQDYDAMPSTLSLALNPTTYAIAFTSTKGLTYTPNYGDFQPTSATMTGAFDAPVFAPMPTAAARTVAPDGSWRRPQASGLR